MAEFRRSYPGPGIAGCQVHFMAAMPPGWSENPTRVAVFPQGAIGLFLGQVRFANLPVRHPGLKWPLALPPDGIAIGIFPEEPASKAEQSGALTAALQPSDFRHVPVERDEPAAGTSLYEAGWRFHVQVRVGSDGPQSESVDQANAVLNSIETTQHLCPCRGRKHHAG
jgi:hypothetical protein